MRRAPRGKYAGTVKVGEKGQIVIPKEIRDLFDIQPGDTLLVLGDIKQGIALIKDGVLFDRLVDQLSLDPEGREVE